MGIKERWRRFEPLPKDIKERLANLKSLFQKEGILLAYLFGSLRKGKDGGDVDLALLAPGERMGDLRGSVVISPGTMNRKRGMSKQFTGIGNQQKLHF